MSNKEVMYSKIIQAAGYSDPVAIALARKELDSMPPNEIVELYEEIK